MVWGVQWPESFAQTFPCPPRPTLQSQFPNSPNPRPKFSCFTHMLKPVCPNSRASPRTQPPAQVLSGQLPEPFSGGGAAPLGTGVPAPPRILGALGVLSLGAVGHEKLNTSSVAGSDRSLFGAVYGSFGGQVAGSGFTRLGVVVAFSLSFSEITFWGFRAL